ncbi:MAG: hypothetical protein R3F02_17060 [Thiolinea sp.]
MMNWGNSPAWNNGPVNNWNSSPWGMPMMNWGGTPGWNPAQNTNWNNTQFWSPFNFGNNSWPTFTMPNINWYNQGTPLQSYPQVNGGYANNRVPAMIYQPVIPVRVMPAPSAIPPVAPLPQISDTLSTIPVMPANTPTPQFRQNTSTIIPETATPLPQPQTKATPEPSITQNTQNDGKQNEPVSSSKDKSGLVFPDPDQMPPELQETTE